ncbi:MAG TPA: alpha/beta hydrolase [Acidimicrobiales bacterium]|nr:alpha/beta hydrolase [Acidimicrobiales bacterium]
MVRSVAVPVDGGSLHVGVWGTGPKVVLGIHGVTASSMALAAVARHLGPQVTLAAPDLRGRGRSNHLPGPYGMRRHAEDCAAVIRAMSDGPLVVVGQSMGAYVAVVLAAAHPGLVERLVLADGGLPMALPEGLDPEVVIEAALGPALSRLATVFPSRAAYREFWRAHPAVSEDWNDDVEAYLDYDLEPVDGGFRSRVCEEAARFDGVEPLADPGLVEASFAALECPIDLLRAPRNLMNQPVPLFPDSVVAQWCDRMPGLHDEMVADTNHYTLMLGRRGAGAIAAKVLCPSARTPT